MPAVFVHGVPVTSHVWDALRRSISRDDVVLTRLPGFGNDLPSGFDSKMDAYADWLQDSIADFDEVDLVGQDWGGLLALRVASRAPGNVRSWAVDSPNLGPNFAWHPGAMRWQSPDQGEQLARWIAKAGIDERTALLRSAGVPDAHALTMAPAIDAAMADAMLQLYRSAKDIADTWGPDLDRITAPGLCVIAGRDPFRTPESVRELAHRLGARPLELPESGHFWMLDEPESVGRALQHFWASLA